MKTIRISRKKWLASEKDSGVEGCLWDPEEKKGCCLGHVIHQTSRVGWKELIDKDMPREFYTGRTDSILVVVKEDGWGGVNVDDSAFSHAAANINDSDELTRKQKEAKLRVLFKENGLRLVFIP